jgi:flavin-dependent dehydrogenase
VISEFDIAVVGAGPAGCAAAIWAAKRGLKTALFEAQEFPRHRPGETLHPGVEVLFRQLGVEQAVTRAAFLRHPGQWVSTPDGTRFEPFGTDHTGRWLGFQAPGADLDQILIRKAVELGVELRQPCRVTAPLLAAGRVCGVRGPGFDLRARYIVDASGRKHWLQRLTGGTMVRDSRPLIAAYGYCRGESEAVGDAPQFCQTAEGWTWIARIGEARYAWARLNFVSVSTEIPERVRTLEPDGPIRRADVSWRIATACAGPGYFNVGDAGSVMDPAASHGVLKALMSGILASDLAARAIERVTEEAVAADAFDRWTREWHVADRDRLTALYASTCFATHGKSRAASSTA